MAATLTDADYTRLAKMFGGMLDAKLATQAKRFRRELNKQGEAFRTELSKQKEELHLHMSILDEAQADKIAAVIETLDSRIEYKLQPVKEELRRISQKLETVILVVKATNHDIKIINRTLAAHDKRLTKLEAHRP